MTANQRPFSEANALDTDDNVAMALFTKDLSEWPDCSGVANVQCSMRRASDGAAKAWVYSIGFKRVGGGDVVVTGSPLLNAIGTTGDLLALAAAGLAFDEDGTNLVLMATGLNNTDLEWTALVNGIITYHTEE